MFFRKSVEMPTQDTALPGRAAVIQTAERHFVFDRPLKGPFPDGLETAVFGMGCFWGAERMFWSLGANKVWTTAVGYAAGIVRPRGKRCSLRLGLCHASRHVFRRGQAGRFPQDPHL